MPLNNNQENVLKLASRKGVKKVAERLPEYWAAGAWLSDRNIYTKSIINKLKHEYEDARITAKQNNVQSSEATKFWEPTHKHMADYIAASTITHCMDGWSYLGQAISAELAGDPELARHLGYYAELRAVMSVLAGDGIGVFDKHHVIVDEEVKCKMVPLHRGGGTHGFAWDALQFWANTQAATTTLQESIHPGGIPLREWLRYFPGTAGFVAEAWLRKWGLDLSRLAKDRNARNLASYRPTVFTSPGPEDVKKSLDMIMGLWEICSPEASGGFPALDRHLLRYVVETLFNSAKERTRKQDPKEFSQYLESMMQGIIPLDRPKDWWLKFLTFQINAEVPLIFRYAEGTAEPTAPEHSKQVLARATLLLRVAAGSASELFSFSTSIFPGGSELDFWWSSDSVRRRLWPEDQPLWPFSDLWIDIEEAIGRLQRWLQEAASVTHMNLWQERAREAASLTTMERTALWGLRL